MSENIPRMIFGKNKRQDLERLRSAYEFQMRDYLIWRPEEAARKAKEEAALEAALEERARKDQLQRRMPWRTTERRDDGVLLCGGEEFPEELPDPVRDRLRRAK